LLAVLKSSEQTTVQVEKGISRHLSIHSTTGKPIFQVLKRTCLQETRMSRRNWLNGRCGNTKVKENPQQYRSRGTEEC
jgi:hypothetical protein